MTRKNDETNGFEGKINMQFKVSLQGKNALRLGVHIYIYTYFKRTIMDYHPPTSNE